MVPRHGGPCIAHALANNRKVVSACITEGVRVDIRHHSPCQLVLNLLTGSSACSGPPRGVCCHKTSTVPHSGLPELPLGHATGHGCRRACLGLIPAPTSVCRVGLSSSPSLALCGVVSGGFFADVEWAVAEGANGASHAPLVETISAFGTTGLSYTCFTK